jgi:hypothetical protein
MGDGEELVPVEVVGVRQHRLDDEIVVLLLDPAAELLVPILIGPNEASAIAAAQAGIVPPRYLSSQVRQFVDQVLGSSGWGSLIQDCCGICGGAGRRANRSGCAA